MRIDSSFVILQDDIGEESEPERRRNRRWVVGGLGVLFVAFILFRFVARGKLSILISLWPMVLFAGVAGWYRLIAWRRSHMQLWMHPRGFELTPSTEESRRAARLASVANVVTVPTMFIIMSFTSRDTDMRLAGLIMAAVAGLMTGAVAYLRHHKNPRVDVQAGDFVRKLIPWRAVTDIEVSQSAPGRVLVRLRRRTRLIGPLDHSRAWIRIDAPCDQAAYDALFTRIRDWEWQGKAG